MAGLLDVNNLSKLLSESKEASESRNQFTQKPSSTAPTQIKSRRGQPLENTTINTAPEAQKSYDPKKIWQDDEIPTEDAILDVRDERIVPRYEFSYKQSIGTEDTFLGLSDKTPLSSDCTHLVVKIHFPNATLNDINLNVTKNRISASTRTHRLFTYLSADVDSTRGKATFDSKREVMTVELPIVHSN